MITFKEYLQDFTNFYMNLSDGQTYDEQIAEELTYNLLNGEYDFPELYEGVQTQQILELKCIMLTYALCSQYLGPNRMIEIFDVLRNCKARFNAILKLKEEDPKANEKQIFTKYLQIYRMIKNEILKEDPTGRSDVKIKYNGTRLVITGLNNTPTVWGSGDLYIAIRNQVKLANGGLTPVLNGRFKKMPLSNNVSDFILKLYTCDINSLIKDLPDKEKSQSGVTWANKITTNDLYAMNLRTRERDIKKETVPEEQNTPDKNIKESDNEQKQIKKPDNEQNDSKLSVREFVKTLIMFSTMYGVESNTVLLKRICGVRKVK